MNRILRTLCLAALAATAPLAAATRPNILFILSDDVGLDNIGCYGSDHHKTPAIDKLAASGMRFQTCYAAPLCGPSRCLLMTGRYAFRTGGITNQSWRPNGPGAKAADEKPMAQILKQAGYATGMAGKWRQVGETPRIWGFDEYLTDNTAGGWYWQTKVTVNDKEVTLPDGTYAPDKVHEFAIDFMRRHKDQPFFFYYAMHHVHAPILRTPDSEKVDDTSPAHYEDNIRYMDKQVAAVVAELEKLGLREKTLVLFSGDNGTALNFPSTIGGRMINGKKGSMLEGGARVPFIASWPGTIAAGKTTKDIISFADCLPTFADLAQAKLPEHFSYDGLSFAPLLRGDPGHPRDYAYVQLGARWYVCDHAYKLNEKAELFDMSDAPFVEKPVAPDADTEASKAARHHLSAVLKDLNPAAGKTDAGGGANKKGKGQGKAKRKNTVP